MSNEIEVVVNTQEGVRVTACEWDDGGLWLHLQGQRATMFTPMTRDEAQQLLAGLQAILNKEVTA